MKNRRARRAPILPSKGKIGRVRVVKDFLPPPDKLMLRKRRRKSRTGMNRQQEVLN